MNDEKTYPGWGSFGTSGRDSEDYIDQQTRHSLRQSYNANITSASKRFFTFHLKYSAAPDGTKIVQIEPNDTEDAKRRAENFFMIEAFKAKLLSLEGKEFRLSGKRDSLTAVIELAMTAAIRPDDVHNLWAKLEWLAAQGEPPLLRLTDKGIEFRNGVGSQTFTKQQLRRRMERQ